MRYAEVVFPIPIKKSFHYKIPSSLNQTIKIGQRVLCPLGRRQTTGFVIDILERTPFPKLKEINKIIEPHFILSPALLELAKWMSSYYISSLGETINTIFPTFLRSTKLVKEDFIETSSRKHYLNTSFPTQKNLINPIENSLKKKKYKSFFLFGISEENKLDIYLHSIDCSLKTGRQVILLVPEISLAPHLVKILQEQLGNARCSIIHSRLSHNQRYHIWKAAYNKEIDIVVGTRSAIFTPFTNIGLIIIDDEHDPSYKEEKRPLYHAHIVAEKRAKIENATLILSSPTPSLESYYHALPRPRGRGEYKLLSRKRPEVSRDLPSIKIVDMKKGKWSPSSSTIFSAQLKEAIQKRLKRKEQSILFLNRKGYSTLILCRRCGFIVECPHCNVSLVYHADQKKMLCHYCKYEEKPPSFCPRCRNRYIRYLGAGTQKVEEEAKIIFPDAKIKRIDAEIAKGEKISKKIFEEFKMGKIDILVGTRLILKAYKFTKSTLLGVISVDALSYIPDFRSAEKIFSLLFQLTGCIRQDRENSEMIIQTFNPSQHALKSLSSYDYNSFYHKEIEFRRHLNYPPFSHLVNIIVRGKNEKDTSCAIEEIYQKLKNSLSDSIKKKETSLLGPAPAYLARRGQNFRWQMVIKTCDLQKAQDQLKEFDISNKKLKITIDVDPINLL